MTTTPIAPISFVPALRDAFAPDDPPADMSYRAGETHILSLTDPNGAPVGDPVREFVDDILRTLDANAGAFRLVSAAAHIHPVDATGRRLDLDALSGAFTQMRLTSGLFPPLTHHPVNVELELGPRPGRVRNAVTALPRVQLGSAAETRSPGLDRAVATYTEALGRLTAVLTDGILAPWLLESGITSLTFAASFTVPRLVRRTSADGRTMYREAPNDDSPTGMPAPFATRPTRLH